MNTDKILAEAIAKDYAPKHNSKIVALKKLDRKAKLPATVFTFSFGIASALVAGTGMSMAMGVLGNTLSSMAAGIIIGAAGFAGCAVNYPIYKRLMQKSKSKYAYDIVQLANEIAEG